MQNLKAGNNMAIARDAAFFLVYQMLMGSFENENKDRVKVFNSVKYVVSHRRVFKHTARMIVRAAYEERFVGSMEEIAELNNIEDEGVTTEESAIEYSDESD